jgi:predicted glycoside hydrolase/deacetylase ChbG (UPF0249 family)
MVLPSLADAARAAEIEDYRAWARKAVETYARYRMRGAENFGGIALSGNLSIENLVATLRSLPEGLTELMVHPGLADTTEGFAGPDREREIQVLTDPRLKILLKQAEVQLTHFGTL